MRQRIDITGQKFGRLTAINFLRMDPGYKQVWLCKCDCGNYKEVPMSQLRMGHTKSCGCIMAEKKKNKKKEYDSSRTPNCYCSNCGKHFYAQPYRIKHQRYICCSKECKREYLHRHPHLCSTFKHDTVESKFFGSKFTRWKMSARKRGISFDDSMDYTVLLDLWNKQKGLCYYTNIPMVLSNDPCPELVSIDRIDSNKGYTRDNIVLCCYIINSWKSSYDMNIFKNFLSKIFTSASVNIKKNSTDAIIPTKEYESAAGFDLYSIDEYELKPGERTLVSTGLSMEIPHNFYGLITGRSGNTIKKGLFIAPGVIDSDYRGNVGIMCFNLSNSVIEINKGDKIAQMLINKSYNLNINEVNELNNTERGDKGFGSTGVVSNADDNNTALENTEVVEETFVKQPKRKPRKKKE